MNSTSNKGSGPSSYRIQDAEALFAALQLDTNEVVVDMGCGRGEYSLKAAEIVGPGGQVYALDRWPTYIDSLKKQADALGRNNLSAMVADLGERLPLQNNSASICLLFTVLHATTLNILERGLGMELRRILQPGGRVAVLELKKEEMAFGPPLKQRLVPGQVTEAFSAWGFAPLSITDLGYTNLIIVQTISGSPIVSTP